MKHLSAVCTSLAFQITIDRFNREGSLKRLQHACQVRCNHFSGPIRINRFSAKVEQIALIPLVPMITGSYDPRRNLHHPLRGKLCRPLAFVPQSTQSISPLDIHTLRGYQKIKGMDITGCRYFGVCHQRRRRQQPDCLHIHEVNYACNRHIIAPDRSACYR